MMNARLGDAEGAVVLIFVSFVGVALLTSSLWLRRKLRTDNKWYSVVKPLLNGDKSHPPKWAFLAIPLFVLGLVSLKKSDGSLDFLLFPCIVAFLTLPVVSGVTSLLVVACCVGLSLLYALGDPAIPFASASPTVRRLVWSILFLLFLIAPFVCSYRSFRQYLRARPDWRGGP